MSPVTAAGTPGATRRPPFGTGRRSLLLAGLAAAWILPVLTHVVAADWLLPLAVLLGVAGLVRGLPNLLDRVVVSMAIVFGALCVAGLLFSVWPWRLHPVAIGGAGLSAIVGFAAVTGRRWALPRRFPPADRLTAVAVAAVGLLAAVPFLGRDLGGRIGLVAPGEDMGRHLMLTDVIGLVGGYAFVHPGRADQYLGEGIEAGLRTYPQGTHFAYAVLSRFLRSSGAATDAVSQADITIWLYVCTYSLLALTVLWAVRRVAGPAFADLAGSARLLPVLTVAAAWLVLGDPVAVFVRGYPNQLTAMALLAVLTAVVVRPLTRFGDQLATVALLLVGISFTYHLFLPYAGLAALVWAVRARAWRRPVVWVTAVLAAPPVLLTPALTLDATSGQQLSSAGTALPTDRPATVALLGLAVAGVLVRHGLRSPARRAALAALAAVVGVTAALGLFQLVTVGRTIYYFEKLTHAAIVVGIVLLGTLARVVPAWWPRVPGRAWLTATAAALVPAVAAGVMLAAAGGRWHTRPVSLGLRFAAGVEAGSPDGGHDAVWLARRWPDGDGAQTVDLTGTPYRNWFGTYFGSVLQRRYRYGHAWYGFLNPPGPPKTLADLERVTLATPGRVRFLVDDTAAGIVVADRDHPDGMTNVEAAEYLAAHHPDRVEVVRVDTGAGR